ncbi:uncharacterized protein EI90DRAFT_3027757 [Cantharellus anzutake]|uniref:uncharacterized protein n=1 Tax=Cantharellus anzutake TaxID=1750568 RepID=UPI0019069DD7|nr:uncharacterized protein EI90DRAFT_3027757 [Cantharellus anzutake]KAF8343980.1 hypothetical protein EI90DRAFT_3027757 [Cantharellus anzutake]
MVSTKAIGIDLGARRGNYSQWSSVENFLRLGPLTIIIFRTESNRTTPSCVAFVENKRLIGDVAKNRAFMNLHNTEVLPRCFIHLALTCALPFRVSNADRLIGRKFNGPGVQSDLEGLPFRIIDRGNKPIIRVSSCGEQNDFVSGDVYMP